MPVRIKCEIIKCKEIAKGIFLMRVAARALLGMSVQPGQFANIEIPGSKELLLPRPFSINYFDCDYGTADFVYQVTGEGTARLSYARGGVNVLLPLGNGFPHAAHPLLIGGGMGVAPLKYVAKRVGCDAILGYRSAAYAFQTEDFYAPRVFTEDGTLGERGFVTTALEQMDLDGYDAVFACGPVPMLKAVKKILNGRTNVYFSMEQRMGCGLGGCAVCVCQTKNGYKKVCTDGPVFNMNEVEL